MKGIVMPNLNVTYDEMQQSAARLDAGKQQITDTLMSLKGMVDQLVASGFQTELASGAFNDTYSQFTTGAQNAINGLEGMSGYLRSAAQAMQTTDSELARAIQQ